jgi:hypothetical protein
MSGMGSGLWSSMGARVSDVPEHPSRTGVESLQPTDASTLCRHAPVTRRYQAEPAALEELINVLYTLLLDVPATAPAPSERTCFSIAPE